MPDACVRIGKNDHVIYSTQGRGAVFRSSDLNLIVWILRWSKPASLGQMVRDVPIEQRGALLNLVNHLCAIGLLTSTEPVPEPANAEAEHLATNEAMAALQQAVYDLNSDLRGLGPAAHAALSAAGELSLKHRIEGLHAAIASLRGDLAALRTPHIRRQLEQLHVGATAKELRLHIGSGGFDLPGWINIDNYPAPLAISLDWGLPFCNASTRFVFMSHVLEHLYPRQAQRLLGDIHRVLQPGGVVRIVVPDIEQWIAAYASGDRNFFDADEVRGASDRTRLQTLLPYAGAVSDPTQLYADHKFGYDFETLKRCLETAGFVDVRRCDYQQSPHEALRVDHASGNAGERYSDRYRSLFVEAQTSS